MFLISMNRKLFISSIAVILIISIVLNIILWLNIKSINKCNSLMQEKLYYEQQYQALLKLQPSVIEEIRFETLEGKLLNTKDSWIKVGNRVKIIIKLSLEGTQIDMFFTPTGTETYKLQRLIDTVVPKNNVAEYVWDVPSGTIGHFWIIAYNGNKGIKSKTYNISSD